MTVRGLAQKDSDFLTRSSFTELGLAEPLRRALEAADYVNPTPIQAQAIPKVLAGRDLLGIAQTGTGKTAAFALPILQRLSESRETAPHRGCRALILAPTRELAVQIGDAFRSHGRHLGLTQTVVLGGVGQRPQVRALARGVDILVATPGRLLDLVKQGHVKLQTAGILVLDEADRMLDMGFIHDVKKIVALLPRRRQSLLFSATMPGDVAQLAERILDCPERVEITPGTITVERIEQRVHFLERSAKRDLLVELLRDQTMSRVIVFTRTKHGADRLARQLEWAGTSAEALHGNKSQGARQSALRAFRAGQVRVLVATDIAARGIDVDGVTHVVNYELPHEPESYVHRIGRTARAGAGGIALAFCGPEERGQLRAIERLIKRPLTTVGETPADSGSSPARTPRVRKGGPKRSRQPQGLGRQAAAHQKAGNHKPSRRRRRSHGGGQPRRAA